jgi:hypothetical protein
VGQRFTGYVDGRPLFDIADSDFPAGRIGLHCGANSAASCREVRVAPPVWVNYYDFAFEERLPAGTRVQVFFRKCKRCPS